MRHSPIGSFAPGCRRPESWILRNVLNSLEDLSDYARFYLQRSLRLRRFDYLSGSCGNELQHAGRRSLTKRAQFRRRRIDSCESSVALDRRKDSSGQKLAARSIRPAESRKRVANLFEASESAPCGAFPCYPRSIALRRWRQSEGLPSARGVHHGLTTTQEDHRVLRPPRDPPVRTYLYRFSD
jgi:hypothetical protein